MDLCSVEVLKINEYFYKGSHDHVIKQCMRTSEAYVMHLMITRNKPIFYRFITCYHQMHHISYVLLMHKVNS